MKIELQRTLKIQCHRVIGTCAFPEERPFELAFLQCIREAEEQGETADLEYIMNTLLPGRPKQLGENLLKKLQDLGLIDLKRSNILYSDIQASSYLLTGDGRAAINKGKVYTEQHSLWDVYWTDDPLFKDKQVLEIFPVERKNIPTAKEDKNKKEKTVFPDLPKQIKNQIGIGIISLPAGTEYKECKIMDFEEKVEPQEDKTSITVHLTTERNQNEVQVSINGTIKENTINNYCFSLPITYFDVWSDLLSSQNLSDYWNQAEEKLHRDFHELDRYARKNFAKVVKFYNPKLREFGHFNPMAVKDVPVMPLDNQNAQQWYEYLITDAIDRYIWQEDFETICKKQRSNFDNFTIILPDRDRIMEMTQDKKEFKEKYWYLRTPVDVAPEYFKGELTDE